MKNKFHKLTLLSLLALFSLTGCNKGEDNSVTSPKPSTEAPVSETIKTSTTPSVTPSNTEKPSEKTSEKTPEKPSEKPTEKPTPSVTPSISEKEPIRVTIDGPDTVLLGETITLQAVVNNATDTTVTWSSENEEILSVENGVVTAHKVGSCKVFATSNEDKTKKAEKEITVKDVYNFRISEDNTYVVEAEDLDRKDAILRSDLNSIIETPTGDAASSTSGGKSIRGLIKGSKLSISFKAEKKARVKILGVFSKYEEGFDLDSNASFSVNGTVLQTNAVFGGHSNPNDYWPWQDITIGDRLLDEGDYTLSIDVLNAFPNADCFKFIVTDYDNTEKYRAIKGDGTRVADAEKLDLGEFVVRLDLAAVGKTAQDLIEEGTEAYNGKCIGGIGKGTKLTVSFYLGNEAFVTPYARRADPNNYDVDSKLRFTRDQTVLTSNGYRSFGSAEGNQYYNWKNVPLTERKLSAGFHTFTYEALENGINLDAFLFETSYYGRTSERGLQITGNNVYTLEAEDIKPTAGSFKTEAPTGEALNHTSGGKSIGNVEKGTIFSLPFNTQKKCSIKIVGVMAKAESVFSLDDNLEIRLDGEEIKTGYSAFGGADGNQYWNWKDVTLIDKEFEAGTHSFTLKAKNENAFPNTDYFRFEVTGYNDLRNIKADGEYKFEGEDLPYSNLTFDAKGAQGRVESSNFSSGGKSLGHIENGYIEFPFYLQDKATVDITLVLSKYESFKVGATYKVYRDGNEIAFQDPELALGRKEDGSNDWFNWKDVALTTQDLSKGEHIFKFELPTKGVNIDYYKFTVSNYGI